MWIYNRKRFPDGELPYADQLYVYILPHNYATLKLTLLFNFPAIWNAEGLDKLNPCPHRYLKNL